MRDPPCPPPAELLRAFSEGAQASLRAHLESCRACASEWGKMGELRALAKRLPARVPDAGQRDQLRAELLARLELPSRRGPEPRIPTRWVWAGGTAAVVACAACLVVLLRLWGTDGTHRRSASASFRATVQTHGPAVRFVHERHGGDELVLLTSGQLLIEVAPLQPGERFRVRCRDAEVEVRGTAFEVDAAGDHLLGVRVLHGRVEVRPSGGRTLLLGAGERWLASPPATAEPTAAPSPLPPAPSVSVAAPAEAPAPGLPPALSDAHGAPRRSAPRREPAASPVRTAVALPAVVPPPVAAAGSKPQSAAGPGERAAPRAPTASVAERAFDEGWAALQLGAEADALGRFLSLYRGSARAGEASAILGWLLLKQGRLDEAAQRFQAAALDSREEIRKSARAGLAAIAARRPPAPAVAP